MMSLRKIISLVAVLALTAPIYAALPGVPGKNRPIRIGMFKGTGTPNRYWHTNIHTAATAIGAFLSNPDAGGLGPNLVKPDSGFTFIEYGVTNVAQCNGGGCTPTTAQFNAFFDALDSLDVVLLSCFVDFGSRMNTGTQAQKDKLRAFFASRGYVGVHAINDSYQSWLPLDTVNAARFSNHPNSDRNGTLRLDTIGGGGPTNASWAFLNAGLADTTFVEEWFSFTDNANVIRARTPLMTTVNIDEASYAGGLGGARQMGADHPMSWFRQFQGGGRMFYTAVGHRVQNYQGGANPRFLRRQLYNAFLWTAGYDTATAVSIRHSKAPGAASEYSRLTSAPGALTVTLIPGGNHSVELLGVDGKRVAFQKGQGREMAYSFTGLRSGVYAVVVSTSQGRSNRLVTIQ